jgi:phosphoserine phosphatase
MVVRQLSLFFVAALMFATAHATDPLPSWNEGPVKQSIIQFVNSISDEHSRDYVPPAERIATIDNDGTLWVEQPLYTQLLFALDRINVLVQQHPDWKDQQPFKSILNHQLDKLTVNDFEKILAVTHTGMSVEAFNELIKKWIATAQNPQFKRPYTDLIYQPMLEVMNYLRQNQFKVYIVSGGGQEFMRAFAGKTYGVPSEQIIGSAMKTKYENKNGKPTLIKLPTVFFIDDNAGKPEAINLFIGKKPIIAFGNSDGDQQMLEWTQSGKGKRLMLLVHHDDAKREYAYDTQSKIGTFSAALMQEAIQNHWQVISMKNDWKVIFPFERH